MIREQPWHTRRASTQHFRWFDQIASLHGLTQEWILEFEGNPASHNPSPAARLLERVFSGSSSVSLESLLDDTQPEDLLLHLERQVFTLQAATVRNIEGSGNEATRPRLEESARRAGRAYAIQKWPDWLRPGVITDLRFLLDLYRYSPYSGNYGSKGMSGLLIKRAIETEVHIELLNCPHSSVYSEVKPVESILCHLYFCWTQGFLTAFIPEILLKERPKKEKTSSFCEQTWSK